MSLFRSQSEEARQRAWLGRIVLIRPLSFAVIASCALAMTVAMAGFFVFGEYTRKARVNGVLSPASGVVRVVAPQAGIVQAVEVREGSSVARDTALVALADRRFMAPDEPAASAVRSRLLQRRRALLQQRASAELALRAEEGAIGERSAAFRRELVQWDRETEAQQLRLLLAMQAATRVARLAGAGFVSSAALDRERDAALEGELRLEASRRARMAVARELAALEHEARAVRERTNAQLAAIDAQLAALDQERDERELQYRAAVVSPVAGTVATLLVEPGQSVPAGAALATLIPEGTELEAHLYAPSRAIGFVRVGQEVMLRFQAYPYQKFGLQRGRVLAMSRNAVPPPELGFVPPDGAREPLYRIKVALASQSMPAYGREEPLQAGMQVDADVLLDRRRLVEWIFEPLLSLAGRA